MAHRVLSVWVCTSYFFANLLEYFAFITKWLNLPLVLVRNSLGMLSSSSARLLMIPEVSFFFFTLVLQIKLFKGLVLMKNLNLRDINDDLQSQFVKTGASVFDFKAKVEGAGVVEGVLRYHPFLYDHETFPTDFIDPRCKRATFFLHFTHHFYQKNIGFYSLHTSLLLLVHFLIVWSCD